MSITFRVVNRVEEYNNLAKELKIPTLMSPVSEATLAATREQAKHILNNILLKKIDKIIKKKHSKKLAGISAFLNMIGFNPSSNPANLSKLMKAERILASIILECTNKEIGLMHADSINLGRTHDL